MPADRLKEAMYTFGFFSSGIYTKNDDSSIVDGSDKASRSNRRFGTASCFTSL